MTGHCPHCNSTFYTPDPGNGGAGRNKCLDCGHIAPVADFHQELEPGGLRITHRQSDDGQSVIYTASVEYRALYQQQPVPNPEGFRTDPRTGNLRPARTSELFHTEKPAAPIRQYKDDDEA